MLRLIACMCLCVFYESLYLLVCCEFSTFGLIDCVFLCICLLVSHRCVSFLVRVWPLDVWGELVPSKIFNPPFPALKAGHLVSYSYICDVCMKWVSGWVSFFLKFLFG